MEKITAFLLSLGAEEADVARLSDAANALQRVCGEDVLARLVSAYESDESKKITDLTRPLDAAAAEVGVHPYTVDALFVAAAFYTMHERYTARYGEEIFLDTARDLVWKLRECRDVYDTVGTRAASWYDLLLRCKIFALGRLQFHTVTFPFTTATLKSGKLTAGQKVIKVHIPSSGKLGREECLDAYRRAYRFFRQEFEGERIPFVCFTWMLSPRIAEGYRAGSNLAGFYGDFEVFDVKDDPTEGDFWRIFGFPYREGLDPAALPRDTALRAHVADIYAAGGGMQFGYGAFYHDGTNIIK